MNEIDLEGNEAKLTTFALPEKEEEQLSSEAQAASIGDFIDNEKISEIKDLIANNDFHKSVLIDVTDFDKTKRSLFHQVLRKEFSNKTSNNTITTGLDKKYIQIKKFGKSDLEKENREWKWPHQYTYFVMFKENIDTIQAVSALAKNLRIKPANLIYAGTKDRRAKTSQWICAKKLEPSKLSQAARKTHGVKVGNFKFCPNTLRLGELTGNHFRVALRAIKGDEDEIEKSLESLKNYGFINYYGLQRFGNNLDVTTFDVGKKLLKSDFKEAVDLILKTREGEPESMQKVRESWQKERNAKEALKLVDRSYAHSIEAKILHALDKFNNDYLQALLQLPRNILLLYTHSYQSLIFNKIASERKKLGLQVIEGDLVFKENTKENVEEIIEEENLDEVNEEEKPKESEFKDMVKVLTKEDADSGKYSIFDIVLALPGYDITYPSNSIGNLYEEMLANDDLSSEKLKGKHRIFSLCGAYRKFLNKPQNLTWKFYNYSNENDELINSDYSKMLNDPEIVSKPDGHLRALVLDFNLPQSTYATMLLRELMKNDTSVETQIKLQKAAKEETKLKEDSLKRKIEDESNNVEVEEKKIKVSE